MAEGTCEPTLTFFCFLQHCQLLRYTLMLSCCSCLIEAALFLLVTLAMGRSAIAWTSVRYLLSVLRLLIMAIVLSVVYLRLTLLTLGCLTNSCTQMGIRMLPKSEQRVRLINSTLNILNPNILKYTLISKNIDWINKKNIYGPFSVKTGLNDIT